MLSNEVKALTPQDVSNYLQVGVRTVYDWIKSNTLPAIQIGRTYRIERRDLEYFIYRHKTTRRSRLWQQHFDRAMAATQSVFREYLLTQGYDPDTLSDGGAERLLHD